MGGLLCPVLCCHDVLPILSHTISDQPLYQCYVREDGDRRHPLARTGTCGRPCRPCSMHHCETLHITDAELMQCALKARFMLAQG